MERTPKPVGSWASLSDVVLAGSQRVGLTAQSLSAASASRQATSAAMTAAQEAPLVPGNHFIYRMAAVGSSLHLPDSFPTSEHLALCLPGDGMILLFEKSCHREDCCSCCFACQAAPPSFSWRQVMGWGSAPACGRKVAFLPSPTIKWG